MRKQLFIAAILLAVTLGASAQILGPFEPVGGGDCALCLKKAGGTMTGAITFNGSQLVAQGANILAQTNLANAQSSRVFNLTDSNTSPVNAEYASLDWATTANTFTITTKGIGTGVTTRNLSIGPTGNAFLNFIANGATIYTVSGATLAPVSDNTKDLGSTVLRVRNVYSARQITGAATPTAASTGTGTGPTNTVDTGSADYAGTITVTAGTTPAATGTITVTFSVAAAYGTNAPVCVAILGNGTGTWNARASLIGGAFTTTSAIFNWDNNAVNLTAASTYKLHYQCVGK